MATLVTLIDTCLVKSLIILQAFSGSDQVDNDSTASFSSFLMHLVTMAKQATQSFSYHLV